MGYGKAMATIFGFHPRVPSRSVPSVWSSEAILPTGTFITGCHCSPSEPLYRASYWRSLVCAKRGTSPCPTIARSLPLAAVGRGGGGPQSTKGGLQGLLVQQGGRAA